MDKNFSHQTSNLPFMRPKMTLNKKKIQNFEKLRRIAEDFHKTKTEETDAEAPTKVIHLIKSKIQDNFDTLYENYEENKKEILENIQQTENDRAGRSALESKAETVVKEKHQYDKLYNEISKKEEKLKKMIDLRDQVSKNSSVNEQELKILQERKKLSEQLEEKKRKVDYETFMLMNMRNERKKVQFFLKEKSQNLAAVEKTINEKLKKYADNFYVKRNILNKIEEKELSNERVDLPQKLKQQLALKFEELETKEKNINILKHESRLCKKFLKKRAEQKQLQSKMVEDITQRREKAEKQNFKEVENELQFKKVEEEKIKKMCGVQILGQIVSEPFQNDHCRLEEIEKVVREKVEEKKRCIRKLSFEIDELLVQKSEIKCLDVNKKEQNLEAERRELRKVKNQTGMREKALKKWDECLHYFIEGKCGRLQLIKKFKNNLSKYKQLFLGKQKLDSTQFNSQSLNKIDERNYF